MIVHITEPSIRSTLAALAVIALAAASGCGGESSPASSASSFGSSSTTAVVSPDLVRVRFEGTQPDESGEVESYEFIADGNRRLRYWIRSGPDAGFLVVWDGVALLTFDPREEAGYTRTDNLDDLPPMTVFFRPGTEAFNEMCPNARPLSTRSLLGRTAVRYACDKAPDADDVSADTLEPREIALDQQTGLVLANGPSVATEVTFGPPIDAETFSTALPAGAESLEPPDDEGSQPPPDGPSSRNLPLDDFRLPAVGGSGYVDRASYRGKPFVVVTGSADGIRSALRRLLPMTRGGSKPAVIGFLFALPSSDWKGSLLNPADEKSFLDSVSKTAGRFPVPVGIDVKGGAGLAITQEISGVQPWDPGFDKVVSIAMFASDGTLQRAVVADKATDADLRAWLARLS